MTSMIVPADAGNNVAAAIDMVIHSGDDVVMPYDNVPHTTNGVSTARNIIVAGDRIWRAVQSAGRESIVRPCVCPKPLGPLCETYRARKRDPP